MIDDITTEKDISLRNLEKAINQCTGNLSVDKRYCWVNAMYWDGRPISSCQNTVRVDGQYKYECKLRLRR